MSKAKACPVAALVCEARRLEDEICTADEARDTTKATRLMAELDAKRAAISYMRPSSNEGALYMLELVHIAADAMTDQETNKLEALGAIERMTGAVSEFLNG